jgi:hypothetical protein
VKGITVRRVNAGGVAVAEESLLEKVLLEKPLPEESLRKE